MAAWVNTPGTGFSTPELPLWPEVRPAPQNPRHLRSSSDRQPELATCHCPAGPGAGMSAPSIRRAWDDEASPLPVARPPHLFPQRRTEAPEREHTALQPAHSQWPSAFSCSCFLPCVQPLPGRTVDEQTEGHANVPSLASFSSARENEPARAQSQPLVTCITEPRAPGRRKVASGCPPPSQMTRLPLCTCRPHKAGQESGREQPGLKVAKGFSPGLVFLICIPQASAQGHHCKGDTVAKGSVPDLVPFHLF